MVGIFHMVIRWLIISCNLYVSSFICHILFIILQNNNESGLGAACLNWANMISFNPALLLHTCLLVLLLFKEKLNTFMKNIGLKHLVVNLIKLSFTDKNIIVYMSIVNDATCRLNLRLWSTSIDTYTQVNCVSWTLGLCFSLTK